MKHNRRHDIIYERLKLLLFAPQLQQKEQQFSAPQGWIDWRNEPRTLPSYIVMPRSFLSPKKNEPLTGRVVFHLSYGKIHPDLVDAPDASARHAARLDAEKIVKDIFREYMGIGLVKIIFDNEHHRMILKIRAKDLAHFQEELQNGRRALPGKSENVVWLDRLREARDKGCNDSSYWR